MNIKELKELKEQVSKNYKREEKYCKEKLRDDYVPLCTSGLWEERRETLIEYSLMGNNVLVIGSEAILDKEKYPDTSGDSEVFLLNCLKEKNKKAYGWATSFVDIADNPNLVKDIAKVVDANNSKWITQAIDMIDPSLRLLLESKCFRLVITTAFDPILEYALRSIWGELTVRNILDERNSERDISRDNNRKSEFYDITPTLFYAFGKAKREIKSDYAINDDMKVLTMANWLGNNKPKELLQYLENKNVLAIGCNFENWVFRFFWFVLGQRPDQSNYDFSKKKGSVAIMFSDQTNDVEKNKEFFDSKDIDYYDNSRIFMSLLASELVDESVPEEGDIFISYASEDFPTARNIFDYLKNQRQSVWFDIRLKAGDRYGDYIEKGIDQCNIFMPILSNQTIKDLKDWKEKKRTEPRYYMREWAMAQEKAENIEKHNQKENEKEMFIVIPIVIEDYSPSDAFYHNTELVPDCIYGASVFYSGSVRATLEDLCKIIDKQVSDWKEKHRNTNNKARF